MRFLKIFITCFLSLIGGVCAVLGVMYLAGSFTKPVIEPLDIAFEREVYNVDDDFMMTISSTTIDVTVKAVTLSLKDVVSKSDDGKFISDGKITIPINVELDKAFKVTLVKAFNEEISQDWIVGGISKITATSDSPKAISKSVNINIDVPVASLSIKTYSNDSSSIENKTDSAVFAYGESFYAEAVFSPEKSMYKFSSLTETKNVYFDITTAYSQYISENTEMSKAMADAGKPYIKGYDVLQFKDEVKIGAYCFISSTTEDSYIKNSTTEQLVSYVKNPTYGDGIVKSLTFTKRTISGFSISNASTVSSLKLNEVSRIYAYNTNYSQFLNLGIQITGSDGLNVSGKISDVGIRALVKEGLYYHDATSSEIVFENYAKVDYALNPNGEGMFYKNNSTGKFETIESLLSSLNTKRYSENTLSGDFDETPYGAFYKDNATNQFVKIEAQFSIQTYDRYYLPNVVATDVNNSYWNIVALKEGVEVAFELYLFGNNDTIENTVVTTKQTTTSNHKWEVSTIVESDIFWLEEENISLTFIDSDNIANVIYPEYDLSQNLGWENENATYTTLKYFVYLPEENGDDPENPIVSEDKVTDIVKNVTLARTSVVSETSSNNKLGTIEGISDDIDIYELDGSVVKACKDGSINAFAVVVKTDYDGRPVLNNGMYEIVAFTKPASGGANCKSMLIVINKTLQKLSAKIIVDDVDMIKNLNPDYSDDVFEVKKSLGEGSNLKEFNITYFNKLAFVQNQDYTPVFKVAIRVSATSNFDRNQYHDMDESDVDLLEKEAKLEVMKKEVALFITAWNEGRITLGAYNSGNTHSNILDFNQNVKFTTPTDASFGNAILKGYYEFIFQVNTIKVASDIDLFVKLNYQKSENVIESNFITDCEIGTFHQDIGKMTESELNDLDSHATIPSHIYLYNHKVGNESVKIEVYDGKTSRVQYNVETSKQFPLIQETTINKENKDNDEDVLVDGETDIYYAESVDTVYKQSEFDETSGTIIEKDLNDSDVIIVSNAIDPEEDVTPSNFIPGGIGDYLISCFDKYGNNISSSITSNDYTIIPNQVVVGTGDAAVSLNCKTIKFKNYSSIISDSAKIPYDDLFINTSDDGEFTKVFANQGLIHGPNDTVSEGTFSDNYIEITDEYKSNNSLNVQISRYGAVGTEIYLNGKNGLLKMLYETSEKKYEFCQFLQYTFTTLNWENTFSGYLSLNSDDDFNLQYIRVDKNIGVDIVLNLVANTVVGNTVKIELTIKKNIVSDVNIITDQGGAEGFNDPQGNYEGVYSDNEIELNIILKVTLKDSFTIYCSDENVSFNESDKSYSMSKDTMLKQTTIKLNFTASHLGMNIIKLYTGEGKGYDFVKEIRLFVNPNLEMTNTVNEVKTFEDSKEVIGYNILKKNVEISNDFNIRSEGYKLISSDDYKPITNADYVDVDESKISLRFSSRLVEDKNVEEIFIYDNDGKLTKVDNIFLLDGTKLKLREGEILYGKYLAKCDLLYGGVKLLGQIYVEISPNMKGMDNSNFINYNGIKCLSLVASTTYNYVDIVDCFNQEDGYHVDSISFVSKIDMSNVYLISGLDGDKIIVGNLVTETFCYDLYLENEIAKITFPVLFMPLNTEFVKYKSYSNLDTDKTNIVNRDYYYLQKDTTFIFDNDICDVYSSGKTTSLIQYNYIDGISETSSEYIVENLSYESITVLIYFVKAGDPNEGYYYHTIPGKSLESIPFIFDLQSVNDKWIKVANQDAVLVEWDKTAAKYLGIFNSEEEFNRSTVVTKTKDYGLSVELYKNNGTYSFRVYDENEFGEPIIGIDSVYASYRAETGLLTAISSVVDRYVWVYVYKSGNAVAKYRIFIQANSALNIYYPYDNGIGDNAMEESIDSRDAEYINFTSEMLANNTSIKIAFGTGSAHTSSILDIKYPNNTSVANVKRVLLQYGNKTEGWVTASNYKLNCSIAKIYLNDTLITNKSAYVNYANWNNENILTIRPINQVLVIYVEISASIDGKDVGSTVYYKIFVNDDSVNYKLYETNEFDQLTENEYFESTCTILNGDIYSFANIALVNDTGISLNRINSGLKYYCYTLDNKDLENYLEVDDTNKTIALIPTVKIVSDLKVHFVLYTIFGVLNDVELIFKSNINYASIGGYYNHDDEVYEVYTNDTFSLTDMFSLQSDMVDIAGLDWQYWSYVLDDGEEFISEEDIKFDADMAGNYNLKIKIALTQFDNISYQDDYIFEVKLNVYESIVSNYNNIDTPLKLTSGTVNGESINGEVVYSNTAINFNTIYTTEVCEEADYLFSVKDTNYLEDYSISYTIKGGEGFVESIILDKNNGTITFEFKPVSAAQLISVMITFISGEWHCDSYLKFNLVPDVNVEVFYPQANPDVPCDYTYESFYLDGKYVNGVTDNEHIDAGETSSTKIDFVENTNAYFSTQRVVFTDSDGEQIPLGTISERTTIKINSISNNIIAWVNMDGNYYMNMAVNETVGATILDKIYVQWVSTTELVSKSNATITFAILVDGLERKTYTINFYSSATDIFEITVTPFYEEKTFDEPVEDTTAELFYVETGLNDNIFSTNQAKFDFTIRQSYLNKLGTNSEKWYFFMNSVEMESKIGEITVNAGSSTVSTILKSRNRVIVLNSIILRIGEDEYSFNPDSENNVYTNYVNNGFPCTISNRLSLTYQGQTVSRLNMEAMLEANGSRIQGEGCFGIDKDNPASVGHAVAVDFTINDVVIGVYYYTLEYDFLADPSKQFDKFTKEVVAGDTITDIFDEFNITRLNGQKFDSEYFENNAIEITTKIIMTTKHTYGESGVFNSNDILYVNEKELPYVQLIHEGITPKGTLTDYVRLLNNNTFTALGASNEGNYVYLLIKYQGSDINETEILPAYAIIKVKVKPNWVPSMYNDVNHTIPNSEEANLILDYTSVEIGGITKYIVDPINLSTNNTLNNYFNIFRAGNVSNNESMNGSFRFAIQGEIADYLQFDSSYMNAGTLQIKNIENRVAVYGNKSGYISITDEYGFVERYYITLNAMSEYNHISYANAIANSNNNKDIYEGSTIELRDYLFNENDSPLIANYAILAHNIDNIYSFGYDQTISFQIDKISSEPLVREPAESNVFKIPVLKDSFYTTTTGKETVDLLITINLVNRSDVNDTEVVVLTVPINIVKRYNVSSSSIKYVRDDINFAVSDYISITDALADESVGEVLLSEGIFSLAVSSTLVNAVVKVGAIDAQQILVNYVDITVGKNPDGTIKNAQSFDGKTMYYYPLNVYDQFKSMDFSQYQFQVQAVQLAQGNGVYLASGINYVLMSNTNIETKTYSYYNSDNSQRTLLYCDGYGNYYYRNIGFKDNGIVNTDTIPSSSAWSTVSTSTLRVTPRPTEKSMIVLASLNSTVALSSTNNDDVYLIKDKLLSVVTTNYTTSAEFITVTVKSTQYAVGIVFNLDYDGKQAISLYEGIVKNDLARGKSVYEINNHTANILEYQKSSDSITEEDLGKLKGIVVYNDDIKIKVSAGMQGKTISIVVFYTEIDAMPTKSFIIANNFEHYIYISLHDILGDEYGINTQGVYKIVLTYTQTGISEIMVDDYKDKIEFITPAEEELLPEIERTIINEIEYVYDLANSSCTYSLVVQNFKIRELSTLNGKYQDNIDILSYQEFEGKVVRGIKKSYLVKYNKDNVVYNVSVNYNAIPKYYSVDASGNKNGSYYKEIYMNQYTYDPENDTYSIDFSKWSNAFNLINNENEVIKTLFTGKDDLYFELANDSSVIGNLTAGNATLRTIVNEENGELSYVIETNPSFDTEQQYIKIKVYTFVGKVLVPGTVDEYINDLENKIYIGDINIVIKDNVLSVAAVGAYAILVLSPDGDAINADYMFTGLTANVSEILTSPNFIGLYDSDENTLMFETAHRDYLVSDCQFTVVSVIDTIFDTTYETGNINIQLLLNETQTSIGASVSLTIDAIPKSGSAVKRSSNPFTLNIGVTGPNNDIFVITSTDAVNPSGYVRGSDGYYNVLINFNIFPNSFVGSDYYYKLNIMDIQGNSESPIVMLPSTTPPGATEGDLAVFKLVYQKKNIDGTFYKLIGIVYHENEEQVSTIQGYQIDTSYLGLVEGDEQVSNYTLSCVGYYTVDSLNSGYLLVEQRMSSFDYKRIYGIAKIEGFSDTASFEIKDPAEIISSDLTKSITMYATENVLTQDAGTYNEYYMPTILNFEKNAPANNISYYGIYSSFTADYTIFGFKPSSNGDINFDVSPYMTTKTIIIKDCNTFFADFTDEQFNSLNKTNNYWSNSISIVKNTYIKTSISQDTYDGGIVYEFSDSPISIGDDFRNAQNITNFESIDLRSITNGKMGVIDNEKYYTYEFSYRDISEVKVCVTVKGRDLSDFALDRLITNYLISISNGYYSLECLEINGDINDVGTYRYELKNEFGVVSGIKAVYYSAINFETTNYFVTTEPIFAYIGGKNICSATLLETNTYSYEIMGGNTFKHIVVNNHGAFGYYAVYTLENSSIGIEISSLTAGNSISVDIVDRFTDISLGTSIRIIQDDYSIEKTYEAYNEIIGKDIVISAHTVSFNYIVAEFDTVNSIEIRILNP